MEITHRLSPQTETFEQIVSPARLRHILEAYGESFDRPTYFGPHDEWYVDLSDDPFHTK